MIQEPRDRLREAMEEAGYNSPTAAWAAMPRAFGKDLLISNLNGHREISRKAAEKYAAAFGVTAGWLLFGDECPKYPMKHRWMDEVFERAALLSEAERQGFVRELVERMSGASDRPGLRPAGQAKRPAKAR